MPGLVAVSGSVDTHDAVVFKMQFANKLRGSEIVSPYFDSYRRQVFICMIAVLIMGVIVVDRLLWVGFIVMDVDRFATQVLYFLFFITRGDQFAVASQRMCGHDADG